VCARSVLAHGRSVSVYGATSYLWCHLACQLVCTFWASPIPGHYVPTCQPQNRNIIAYRNAARGEPSHGHRNTHNLLMIARVYIVPEICSWRQDTLVTILRSSNGILSHEMSAKDSRNRSCYFAPNTEVSRTDLPPVSDRITEDRYAIFVHVARLPAHQALLRQVELSVGRPPDPTWKRQPGHPRTKWTDQLRRDNNNVPIATLWRQAVSRGHSRATLRSKLTSR